MNKMQGKNIFGHLKIQIKGNEPAIFFRQCTNEQIPIWNLKKLKGNICIATIYNHDLKKVNQIADQALFDISIVERKGYFYTILHLWKRKEVLFAFIFCALLLIMLANIAWKIEVIGVPTELEEKISAQLKEQGLYKGAWTFTLKPLNMLQQNVADEIPELLYIGIEKKGTTYVVQAEEKLIVEAEEDRDVQHLIANKSGVIQKMLVKNGQALVRVNDHVKKGEILVSGLLETSVESDEEETAHEMVIAEGEVYANTWYEVQVTSSLYRSHEKLSGEYMTKYLLQVAKYEIPIWGFRHVPFEQAFEETEKRPITILNFKTPISIKVKTLYNQDVYSQIRTIEDARETGILHALDDLKIRLGTNADILNYYVLHESVENGKVTLNLYISVLEDIASSSPIH